MARGGRAARIVRKTRETAIDLALTLDRDATDGAPNSVRTPVEFMNHMLELFAAHGGFGLRVRATGDVKVDDHHLVEDLGIVLGQALGKALGDRKGIRRYGDALVPMDESLVQVAIDLSGRSYLGWDLRPAAPRIKAFDTALVKEFFLGFAREAKATMHVRLLTAKGNAHHEIEAAFKSFGRALGAAVERRGLFKGVPSTKGRLE